MERFLCLKQVNPNNATWIKKIMIWSAVNHKQLIQCTAYKTINGSFIQSSFGGEFVSDFRSFYDVIHGCQDGVFTGGWGLLEKHDCLHVWLGKLINLYFHHKMLSQLRFPSNFFVQIQFTHLPEWHALVEYHNSLIINSKSDFPNTEILTSLKDISSIC